MSTLNNSQEARAADRNNVTLTQFNCELKFLMHTDEPLLPSWLHGLLFQRSSSSVYVPQRVMHTCWSTMVAPWHIITRKEKANQLIHHMSNK